jgi:hypothetical protein
VKKLIESFIARGEGIDVEFKTCKTKLSQGLLAGNGDIIRSTFWSL